MLESKLFRSIINHFSHITWFCRNSAFVSLLATLSHRTWIANDFSSFQFLSKWSKISDCTFWKFSYKRKFFFLLISCTRNWHSTMIENYIKRDDVIKCELDLVFTEKSIHYLALTDYCREDADKFSQIIERVTIRFLKRREIEQICLWLMILSNRQLSFDR
jgi:hypothetical protein